MRTGKIFIVFQNFRNLVERSTKSPAFMAICFAIAMAAWLVSGNAISTEFLMYFFLLLSAHFMGAFYSAGILSPINIISHYVDPNIKEEVLVIGGGMLYVIYMVLIAYCAVYLLFSGAKQGF